MKSFYGWICFALAVITMLGESAALWDVIDYDKVEEVVKEVVINTGRIDTVHVPGPTETVIKWRVKSEVIYDTKIDSFLETRIDTHEVILPVLVDSRPDSMHIAMDTSVFDEDTLITTSVAGGPVYATFHDFFRAERTYELKEPSWGYLLGAGPVFMPGDAEDSFAYQVGIEWNWVQLSYVGNFNDFHMGLIGVRRKFGLKK